MKRDEIWQELAQEPQIDVLIIGGGINGIGLFRELALNGVRVLLIDRSDFMAGASAASSHMAHGGIRYLENGEFRLVREAVRERNRLLALAPHLVRPLPTAIPIFKIFSGLSNAPLKFFNLLDRPAERGALVIKLGLMLYDAYTSGRNRQVPRHRFLGRRSARKRWPQLHPQVRFVATYYDGLIREPERLGLELITQAEASSDTAWALNYVRLLRLEEGQVFLRDEEANRTLAVRPRLIFNAAGPWIDAVNRQLGLETHYIGGTKGSHLVLNHPDLRAAVGEHEFFFENDDGRIVLILPWFDKVIIGTSDLPIDDPDTARCTDDEIEYFFGMVRRVFPQIKIAREHIVFQFSGVRPLAYQKKRATGQITRDHSLKADHLGTLPLYSLVGGKWTTFRAFAEQAADQALADLGRERQQTTRDLPVGGGCNYPATSAQRACLLAQIAEISGLAPQRLETLFARYGTQVLALAHHLRSGKEHPLVTLPTFSREEIAWLVSREKVVHLDDFVLRRTSFAMRGLLTRAAVAELTEVIGEALAWEAPRRQAEAVRLIDLLRVRHGVHLGE